MAMSIFKTLFGKSSNNLTRTVIMDGPVGTVGQPAGEPVLRGRPSNAIYELHPLQADHPIIHIERLPFSVGRMATVGVDGIVPVNTVSARHAEFMQQDGQLTVRDMDSVNGTFVNGLKIKAQVPVLLTHGTTVAFGQQVVYRVYDPRYQRHVSSTNNGANPTR